MKEKKKPANEKYPQKTKKRNEMKWKEKKKEKNPFLSVLEIEHLQFSPKRPIARFLLGDKKQTSVLKIYRLRNIFNNNKKQMITASIFENWRSHGLPKFTIDAAQSLSAVPHAQMCMLIQEQYF